MPMSVIPSAIYYIVVIFKDCLGDLPGFTRRITEPGTMPWFPLALQRPHRAPGRERAPIFGPSESMPAAVACCDASLTLTLWLLCPSPAEEPWRRTATLIFYNGNYDVFIRIVLIYRRRFLQYIGTAFVISPTKVLAHPLSWTLVEG